ncbi:MAG: DUF3597 domain-containing protein [Xanthomonadales bacterium]|nr:DUF3597 domain-containing protein [Xanthomonadales bacterium]
MSVFGSILQKLGMRKAQSAALPSADTPAEPVAQAPAATLPPVDIAAPEASAAEPAVAAVPLVDVMARLEEMAAANPQKLNWKTSIVDLLKLLGLDSSLDARRELARELEAPAEKFNDSASLNIWLHKTVLQKLAENGGNIPPELL